MVPFALFAALALSQASVRCDETRRVAPNGVKKAVMELRRELAKRGLHVTDLPSDGVAARRLLEAQMKTHAWCGADDQIRVIEGALTRAPVDQTLVSAKVARASGLSRGLSARSLARVDGALEGARRELGAGRLPRANTLANQALFTALGSRDPWFLPKPPPQNVVTAFAAGEELPEKEVTAACPNLGKGRGLTLETALQQLAATLDTARVRAIEIRRGPNLLEQLEQAARLRDTPKAIRTACVLSFRAGEVADGLDRVMARFQRVNVLRDERGVAAPEQPQFDALVNEASRQIAARDYAGARSTLETLLVFLGDPEQPSGNLPAP